ncbi:uncharacterized protein [Chironomus tepperi]|uniref:uncharacterized protein n=1 Tax=Chironomus tepperi TaxID=113505 RepID=UPI00391F147B
MAPSATQAEHQHSTMTTATITTTSVSNDPWCQPNQQQKENQRPPVFYPEDYILALRKFSKFGSNNNSSNSNANKSIYDTIDDAKNLKSNTTNGHNNKSRTLPLSKTSDYKSPVAPADTEMTLKQFVSITELLTKLRADLKQSFQSFVQEFVANPMDGVSLLLEVLRGIQLSQNTITGSSTLNSQNMDMRNNQSYQRRALLDELTCLQCLSICCSRTTDASIRLGNTPVGLLPLACSATNTGIRARILALQLLTTACDPNILGDHVPKASYYGHQAVSESLTTLRLRCAEPVRFRLLIGILNSGGGSGELQYVGIKFINTFLESSDSIQTRLYLQAELYQAGLDPPQMSKLISSTSPWLQKLQDEIKHWESIKIDVEVLQKQVRNAEQCRSKMVILERKVEMLQEEKNVFTSIERRLQEKCADLQRELMQLKKSNSTTSTLEKPVALPRQTLANGQKSHPSTTENEDEGISSSETGQSSSPVPMEYKANNKMVIKNDDYDESNTTIDDVIEELTNIVNDAEREIIENGIHKPLMKSRSEDVLATSGVTNEYDSMIIPSNLLPQPPSKKANKSLIHILGPQHDVEGSDYDYYIQNVQQPLNNHEDERKNEESHSLIYENEYELDSNQKNHPDIVSTIPYNGNNRQKGTDDNNRHLLNVIMDAREKEQQSYHHVNNRAHSLERDIFPPQQFNGVFFMSDMNPMTPATKFSSKPDIMAALGKQRSSKNYGVNSMVDVVMTSTTTINHDQQIAYHQQVKPRQIFLPSIDKFSSPQNHQQHLRMQSHNGPKVTDLISGLY